MDQYDEKAAELLPCTNQVMCTNNLHSVHCAASLRPAIAAALREAEQHQRDKDANIVLKEACKRHCCHDKCEARRSAVDAILAGGK